MTGKGDTSEVKGWSSHSLETINKALYLLSQTNDPTPTRQIALQSLSYLKTRIIDIETRAMSVNPFSAGTSQQLGNSADREREFNKVVVSGRQNT